MRKFLNTTAAVFLASGVIIASGANAEEASNEGSQCSGDSNYADAVLQFEGGGDPYATNPNSTATGSYQFLFGTLQDLGYIEKGQSTPSYGEGDWAGVVWTGKDGIFSRDQFMASSYAQDNALAQFTSNNLKAVSETWEVGQVVDGVPLSEGGVALATHMMGAGAFMEWANSGFSPSALDPDIAAAHGWTQEGYQEHLLQRIAAGGCYDPSLIESSSLTQDLPEIFLMPWEPDYLIPAIYPGTIASAM